MASIARLCHELGVDINSASFGAPLLVLAARRGKADIVRELLSVPGVDVNCADAEGETPLMAALVKEHNMRREKSGADEVLEKDGEENDAPRKQPPTDDVLSMLLDSPKPDVMRHNTLGETALHIACRCIHLPVVVFDRLLTMRGMDVNKVDSSGKTALIEAARLGYAAIVDLLLQQLGIDVKKADTKGNTALIEAARLGYAAIVDRLLQHPGIDVNKADADGNTALIEAVRRCHFAIMDRLLWHPDVDVNKANANGRTALIMAAQVDHVDIVAGLLQHPDIEVNKADINGRLLLCEAAYAGRVNVVVRLLQRPDISVNHIGNGSPALVWAAGKGHVDVVVQIVKHPDIDVNTTDSEGNTAIIVSADNGHANVVDHLLEHPDIDVNMANAVGNTAILVAAGSGHVSIVDRLLQHPGIDVEKANAKQYTPLVAAVVNNCPAVVYRLLKCPAVHVNVNLAERPVMRSPLQFACRYGFTEIVSMLLDRPDTDVNRCRNVTPLFKAVSYGHARVVAKLLAKEGIDVHKKCTYRGRNGVTALQEAVHRQHNDIVMQLLVATNSDFRWVSSQLGFWKHVLRFEKARKITDDLRTAREAKVMSASRMPSVSVRVTPSLASDVCRHVLFSLPKDLFVEVIDTVQLSHGPD